MGVLFTKNDITNLSSKADSLRYLHQSNLPTVQSIIVPRFKEGDTFLTKELPLSDFYYARLCFRDKTITKKGEGRIVHKTELQEYVRKLSAISEINEGDLLIQPFLIPKYAGSILKKGKTLFVEMAYGLIQTLLHRGRFSYRAVLVDNKIICLETIDQEIAVIWDNNAFTNVKTQGWDMYNPLEVMSQLTYLIEKTDNILFEWGMVDDSLVFFDHREILSGFPELSQSIPSVPRNVSTTMDEIVVISPHKQILFLEYPDINDLLKARMVDFVVIDKGALLSHLSVYSVFEKYKCVFKE